MAQAVDASTGTLYMANKASNTVTVDGEGGTKLQTPARWSVSTGTEAGRSRSRSVSVHKVFVANAGSTFTDVHLHRHLQQTMNPVVAARPPKSLSGGHLEQPDVARRVGLDPLRGEQQRHRRDLRCHQQHILGHGYAAVVHRSRRLWLSMPPTARSMSLMASHSRIEYFNARKLQRDDQSGCCATPTTSLRRERSGRPCRRTRQPLRRQCRQRWRNLGRQPGHPCGGQAPSRPVAGLTGIDGTGLVQSIGMSPDNQEGARHCSVGLTFPGDVMATIDPTTNSIIAHGWPRDQDRHHGPAGQRRHPGYVWVTDEIEQALTWSRT